MKKLMLAMIAAGIAVALIYSCSKETTPDTERFDTTIEEPDVSRLILNFTERLEARNEGLPFKSEESISIDSAIWYIDATLNYSYAKANHSFGRLHWDTVYLEMNVLDSYKAMYADVLDSYDASLNGLSDRYHSITEENKQFMMAMVEDMGPLPGSKRNLRIITVTGTGTLENSGDFDENEAYLWNRNATYNCDFEPSVGAPIKFEALLNSHYNPEPGNNCRWWFYGQTTVVKYDYKDPIYLLNNPLTNYLDYKIFAASQEIGNITDETKCLEYGQGGSDTHEMQFYYDYLKGLVDEWLASGNNTGNLRFAPSEIKSVTEIQPSLRIYHYPHINFRKRTLECTMPIEPPID
jgi:hypothetical protein